MNCRSAKEWSYGIADYSISFNYHNEMFSHVFEQNYWHIVAASLLLIWTLFSAIIDGVFSPKKWREMPKAKKRMYLAFLFIGLALSMVTFFAPILAGACLICFGIRLIVDDYCECRGHRWDYRFEQISFGITFILIGIIMFLQLL